MITVRKAYYRRELAKRRRISRIARKPRIAAVRPDSFRPLNERFCDMTILPRIAQRDELLPLDRICVVAMDRYTLEYYGQRTISDALMQCADTVERSLFSLLAQSANDEPIRIEGVDVRNAIRRSVELVDRLRKVPAAHGSNPVLIVPPFMAAMIMANKSYLSVCTYTDKVVPPSPIRSGVYDFGTLEGCSVLSDEVIAGQSTAYAIDPEAVLWNFAFSKAECELSRDTILLKLRYGFCVSRPKLIARMKVRDNNSDYENEAKEGGAE